MSDTQHSTRSVRTCKATLTASDKQSPSSRSVQVTGNALSQNTIIPSPLSPSFTSLQRVQRTDKTSTGVFRHSIASLTCLPLPLSPLTRSSTSSHQSLSLPLLQHPSKHTIQCFTTVTTSTSSFSSSSSCCNCCCHLTGEAEGSRPLYPQSQRVSPLSACKSRY